MLRIEHAGLLVPIPSSAESDGDAAVAAYLASIPSGATQADVAKRYADAMQKVATAAADAAHAAAEKRKAEVSGPNAGTAPSAQGTSAPAATSLSLATGDDDEE